MPQQNVTPAHHGGEEWRDIDASPSHYDPADHADILSQAKSNILDIRRGKRTIKLTDRDGNPLPGVTLSIDQTQHAFPFGEQVWSLDAKARNGQWESEWARAWRRRFEEIFNAVNNLCYWTERPRHDGSKTEDQQGDWRLENFATTVDWSLARGMLAKGHPLFWSIPKCVPDWVRRYDHETMMKFAEVRVRNIVARFKGRVTHWDAVNEPMWEAVFKNLDNREWPHIEPIDDIADMISHVLRWCKEEDPAATFYVNDYGMTATDDKVLTGNDGSKVTASSQRKRYIAMLNALAERGTPADGLGLQSHTGWMPHALQWSVYDEMHQGTGLPIIISEFWAKVSDLRKEGKMSEQAIDDLQAEYIANVLTTAFGHPAIEGFYFWGFMGDAIVWQPSGGHDLRAAFTRVKQLIHEEWSTNETVTTDADGRAELTGFYGQYTATHRADGKAPQARAFNVDPQNTGPIHLTMPITA